MTVPPPDPLSIPRRSWRGSPGLSVRAGRPLHGSRRASNPGGSHAADRPVPERSPPVAVTRCAPLDRSRRRRPARSAGRRRGRDALRGPQPRRAPLRAREPGAAAHADGRRPRWRLERRREDRPLPRVARGEPGARRRRHGPLLRRDPGARTRGWRPRALGRAHRPRRRRAPGDPAPQRRRRRRLLGDGRRIRARALDASRAGAAASRRGLARRRRWSCRACGRRCLPDLEAGSRPSAVAREPDTLGIELRRLAGEPPAPGRRLRAGPRGP